MAETQLKVAHITENIQGNGFRHARSRDSNDIIKIFFFPFFHSADLITPLALPM